MPLRVPQFSRPKRGCWIDLNLIEAAVRGRADFGGLAKLADHDGEKFWGQRDSADYDHECQPEESSLITGEIKSQIDKLWDAFWSGGITNPLEVMEQITYLLFIKRLDDLQTADENKAARLKTPIERRVFPLGVDSKGLPYADLRWSRLKNFEAA